MLYTDASERDDGVWMLFPAGLAKLYSRIHLACLFEVPLGFEQLDRNESEMRKELLRRELLGRQADLLGDLGLSNTKRCMNHRRRKDLHRHCI